MRIAEPSVRFTLELDPEERDLLAEVLRDELGTLREQTYHADTSAFKGVLKREQQVVRSMIAKLGQAAAAAG